MPESILLGPRAIGALDALIKERRGARDEGVRYVPDELFQGIQIREGVLDGHLLPSGAGGATETTAEMSVYRGQKDAWGDKGETITVTNRSAGLFLPSGSLVQVVRVNGEWRPLCPFSMLIGKVDEEVTAPEDDVTVSVWSGTAAGSLSDTTENITAYCRFGDLDVDAWVAVQGFRHGFEIIQGQCPA